MKGVMRTEAQCKTDRDGGRTGWSAKRSKQPETGRTEGQSGANGTQPQGRNGNVGRTTHDKTGKLGGRDKSSGVRGERAGRQKRRITNIEQVRTKREAKTEQEGNDEAKNEATGRTILADYSLETQVDRLVTQKHTI